VKKEPKAVYIIENGGYTELTYEEFRRRVQICPLYADKLFLPLYGSLMEVSKEDYEEYYRQRNRQIYIDRRASRNGDVSYNALTTDEFNGEDILIAEQPDVCDTVVESIMTDKLRKAILKLTDEEQLLIYRHYYADIPGTELAKIYGVSQQAISKKIAKIRAKLKNLLEN
jgi:RNA polymerase sigma factor (sigma-70 family)